MAVKKKAKKQSSTKPLVKQVLPKPKAVVRKKRKKAVAPVVPLEVTLTPNPTGGYIVSIAPTEDFETGTRVAVSIHGHTVWEGQP